jgi:hypothetical protein
MTRSAGEGGSNHTVLGTAARLRMLLNLKGLVWAVPLSGSR